MPFVEPAERPRFPNMPERIARLPVDHRGFPVPWFVAWVNGKPDHRIMDASKVPVAIKQSRCWICGDILGRHKAFAIGPMGAITRTAPEPPSHRECLEFAARVCPFLSIPAKPRREKNLPNEATVSDDANLRNPGVVGVWLTDNYQLTRDTNNQTTLFKVGDPKEIIWYCEGRLAHRQEVLDSLTGGMQFLEVRAVIEQLSR